MLPALLSLVAAAHPPGDRVIEFPDVPGAVTMVCDLHMHTVFSDGSVWPNIRTMEAERDGLDCIATTEHLEYQPHRSDIPHRNRNRAYEVASEALSEGSELIVINGSEITRDMPPGHANAVFLTDANALLKKNPRRAFQEAKRQGAFIFWNHPHWTRQRPDGVAQLDRMHERFIKDGLLHGIEVVNDTTYSDEALQIALDHDLTILATSDIHGLVDWRYKVPEGGHRPVTLVFAEERSGEAIKRALFEHRTVAWFDGTLIGREDQLRPLVDASLQVRRASYGNDDVLDIVVENVSDADFLIRNRSDYTLHTTADVFTLPAHQRTTLAVKTLERLSEATLDIEVLNAVIAPKQHLRATLSATVTEVE